MSCTGRLGGYNQIAVVHTPTDQNHLQFFKRTTDEVPSLEIADPIFLGLIAGLIDRGLSSSDPQGQVLSLQSCTSMTLRITPYGRGGSLIFSLISDQGQRFIIELWRSDWERIHLSLSRQFCYV